MRIQVRLTLPLPSQWSSHRFFDELRTEQKVSLVEEPFVPCCLTCVTRWGALRGWGWNWSQPFYLPDPQLLYVSEGLAQPISPEHYVNIQVWFSSIGLKTFLSLPFCNPTVKTEECYCLRNRATDGLTEVSNLSSGVSWVKNAGFWPGVEMPLGLMLFLGRYQMDEMRWDWQEMGCPLGFKPTFWFSDSWSVHAKYWLLRANWTGVPGAQLVTVYLLQDHGFPYIHSCYQAGDRVCSSCTQESSLVLRTPPPWSGLLNCASLINQNLTCGLWGDAQGRCTVGT